MNWVFNLFKKINIWFDIFVKKGREEYQLDKYFIPEHKELKQAHQLLLKEYVRAITATSRLSFFVGYNEIKIPKEGFIRRFLMLLLAKYSPFRLLILKPLVIFFVETHIAKKLSELSIAYTQITFLVQNSLVENSDYLLWLVKAKQECDEFKQTLSSGKIFFEYIKYLGTFILGLLLAIVGANTLGELTIKLLSNSIPKTTLMLFAPFIANLIVVIPYVYLFLESTFAAKRVIFMGIGTEISDKHNVYVFENEVFKLLGRSKAKEFPIDYFLQSVFNVSFIALFWWMQNEFEKAVSGPNVIVLPYFSCISILFSLFLVFDVLVPFQKRYTQNYM